MKTIPAIELVNITKKYIIHHEKPTLAENILNGWRHDKFVALKNVSISINNGERIGIIGNNGSGKTTLLKVISGITTPTNGQVKVSGKLVSLIDLEAGFHPDLTGEENLFLNAMIIGMTRSETLQVKDKILDFAQLGDFISSPLYTYSSGMKLRLGFSVAAYSNPEIILLDENISVGDKNFQSKIDRKLSELQRKRKTFILVSHDLSQIQERCERVIWLNEGKVMMDGRVDQVLRKYRKF